MRLLLIDNGTSYLDELKNLLKGEEIELVAFDNIDFERAAKADAIILSGGHSFPVMGNEGRIERELDLIRNGNKPVLGICFGFELIARAFGSTLKEMRNKEKGLISIKARKDDGLLKGIPNLQVFENHSWAIDELSDDLEILASSDDRAEIIRHASKPIYGLQFHPEMLTEKCCGDEIFYNFIKIAKQKKTP